MFKRNKETLAILEILSQQIAELKANQIRIDFISDLTRQTYGSEIPLLKKKVDKLEETINTIWGLPMFKPYRGKK